jgi:hypothetical protein
MLPYWFLFLIPTMLAFSHLRPIKHISLYEEQERWPNIWRLIYVVLVLMIGLRHEVGGDWVQYLEMLDSYVDQTNLEQFAYQDPAFVLFNKLAIWSGTGIYLLNLLSAVFFVWGLVVFCRAQPLPWLALVVSVPYLITVVAMGYTRQGVAIGIGMIAMIALDRGKTIRFIFWIAIAALFHKSAIILIPMAFLSKTKKRFITFCWVFLAGFTLFILLLQEASSFLIYGYIESQYQSAGATIRIAMNAVPGAIFLLYRKRFYLTKEQLSFWTWMSWTSMFFVILLILSPSSTAVDRVALYWIPLQIFVLSRLPNALKNRNSKSLTWVCAVIAYSGVVHFVWLNYADTSFAWLPYKFYPWVKLWE